MRRILVLLVTMAAALVVVAGVAYAATITCTGGTCVGTNKPDRITGTEGPDFVNALGGKDTVFLLGGNDIVNGFGGNDIIHGGLGDDGGTDFFLDNLEGQEGSDQVYGEEGNDLIDAASFDTAHSRDRSFGGEGADSILAVDGNKDLIECGAGEDTVQADPNDLINGVAASSQAAPIGDCENVQVV